MTQFDDLTAKEVIELVEADEFTPQEAIEIEQNGKNRSTLIDTLQKMIPTDEQQQEETQQDKEQESDQGNSSDETNDDQEEQSIKVTLLKNIKYKRQRYKIGEEIEIDPMDVESFIKASIIKG